jgi:hypothetical protein
MNTFKTIIYKFVLSYGLIIGAIIVSVIYSLFNVCDYQMTTYSRWHMCKSFTLIEGQKICPSSRKMEFSIAIGADYKGDVIRSCTSNTTSITYTRNIYGIILAQPSGLINCTNGFKFDISTISAQGDNTDIFDNLDAYTLFIANQSSYSTASLKRGRTSLLYLNESTPQVLDQALSTAVLDQFDSDLEKALTNFTLLTSFRCTNCLPQMQSYSGTSVYLMIITLLSLPKAIKDVFEKGAAWLKKRRAQSSNNVNDGQRDPLLLLEATQNSDSISDPEIKK